MKQTFKCTDDLPFKHNYTVARNVRNLTLELDNQVTDPALSVYALIEVQEKITDISFTCVTIGKHQRKCKQCAKATGIFIFRKDLC